jgi:hypothetical protein
MVHEVDLRIGLAGRSSKVKELWNEVKKCGRMRLKAEKSLRSLIA